MTRYDLWQIDAFADTAFAGNPAAVVPLQSWPDNALLQAIANENNLSETAFFVQTAPGRYHLRWFTPVFEVDLCGHATLASAWLILNRLEPEAEIVRFDTRSGELCVRRAAEGTLSMDLPADPPAPFVLPSADFAARLGEALDAPPPAELFRARYLMAVWEHTKDIRTLNGPAAGSPLLRAAQSWGLIVTAPGSESDFVSRFFAPDKGVPEDPVTGSAHCILAPFWAQRLGKNTLSARQISRRGGTMLCHVEKDRVIMTASCALYLQGSFEA